MELLFHLFFIICHPYIPLHFVEMIFYTCFTHFFMGKPHENRSFKFVAHSSLHLQFVRVLLWSTLGMMPAVQ